uniref:Uncharacterized protein n=1 Tax=Anguilla anguilla TaxID=7936 RepID=A0A0E9PTL3_ANGAN
MEHVDSTSDVIMMIDYYQLFVGQSKNNVRGELSCASWKRNANGGRNGKEIFQVSKITSEILFFNVFFCL